MKGSPKDQFKKHSRIHDIRKSNRKIHHLSIDMKNTRNDRKINSEHCNGYLMTLKSSRMIKKNEERQEGTFTSSNSRSLSTEEARYLGSFLPICLSLFTVSLSVKYPILSQDAIFCAEEMEHIHTTRGYFIAESGAQHNIHTATRYFIALTVSMYNSTQLNSAKCWTCKQVHKKK